jgi:hypothetical protein
MCETRTGDLPEHTARVSREQLGQLGAALLVERTSRIKVIGTVEDPPHHIPFGEAERVIPHCVEHATVGLSLRPGVGRAGRSMP